MTKGSVAADHLDALWALNESQIAAHLSEDHACEVGDLKRREELDDLQLEQALNVRTFLRELMTARNAARAAEHARTVHFLEAEPTLANIRQRAGRVVGAVATAAAAGGSW